MTSSSPRFTVFVLVRALPAWLSLPRDRRNEIGADAIAKALGDDKVALRHFDAEAFSSFCSDISVFETADLAAFYFVMERLRDSQLFAKPYFELIQILPAIEGGFRRFEQAGA